MVKYCYYLGGTMGTSKSSSNRILATPSAYARKNYLYVQEVGTLLSVEPHISKRQNLNSFLFMTVISGSGTVTFDGTSFPISEGGCAWIDCSRSYSHESSAEDPWTLMWVHFYGNLASSFYAAYIEQENPFLFTPPTIVPFTDALHTLYQVHESKNPLLEIISHKCLTDIILLCFTSNCHKAGQDDTVLGKMQLVLKYIDEHYMEKINLDILSDTFYISKYHLSREYKRVFGVTLGNDLTAKRISHAKSMLRFTSASIEQIAIGCGFQNAGYFIKVFRKAENMTPLEYRKKW